VTEGIGALLSIYVDPWIVVGGQGVGVHTLSPKGGLLLEAASGKAVWLFDRASPGLTRPKPNWGVLTPAEQNQRVKRARNPTPHPLKNFFLCHVSTLSLG
jgi:hypothetical protein